MQRNSLSQKKRPRKKLRRRLRRSLRRKLRRKQRKRLKRLKRKRRRRFLVFLSSQPLVKALNLATLPNRLGRLSQNTSLAKNVIPLSRVQPHPVLMKRPPLPQHLLQMPLQPPHQAPLQLPLLAPLLEVKLKQLLMLKLLLIRQLLMQRRLVKSIKKAPARLLQKRLKLMPNRKRQIRPKNLQKLLLRQLHMLLQPRQMLK